MVQPISLFSFMFFTFHLSVSGVISATFTLVNQCNYTVWPASITNSGNATLEPTGFLLKSGQSSTITAPSNWSGRFWGRTLCKTNSATGNFSCVTGDCGTGKVTCNGRGSMPPATLAEFSLGGVNGLDFYDVSLVDGYNIPMMIIPVGGSSVNCNSTGCPADLNMECPTELQLMENNQVVACQGPCAQFNLQFFCCAGNYTSPEKCKPSVYANIFKAACPDAYSYVFDDKTSTFSCSSADYNITFCPASNNARRSNSEDGNLDKMEQL